MREVRTKDIFGLDWGGGSQFHYICSVRKTSCSDLASFSFWYPSFREHDEALGVNVAFWLPAFLFSDSKPVRPSS